MGEVLISLFQTFLSIFALARVTLLCTHYNGFSACLLGRLWHGQPANSLPFKSAFWEPVSVSNSMVGNRKITVKEKDERNLAKRLLW